MKYLEKSIKFLIKNWIMAVPLFILTVLATFLGGTANTASTLSSLRQAYGSLSSLTDPGGMLSSLPAILPSIAIGNGLWVMLFNFVAIPATYGLVNKSLDTGMAGLNDIGSAISRNFVRYIIYFVGMLVLSVALGLGSFLVLLVPVFLAVLIRPLIILTIPIAIALAAAVIILMALLSMWLPAMVVDGLDITAAAKKSIEAVKSCFWTVLGITVLVAAACGIAGFILGLLSVIPLLGPIIASIVPTLQTFIMIVFLLILYRDITGKINNL